MVRVDTLPVDSVGVGGGRASMTPTKTTPFRNAVSKSITSSNRPKVDIPGVWGGNNDSPTPQRDGGFSIYQVWWLGSIQGWVCVGYRSD